MKNALFAETYKLKCFKALWLVPIYYIAMGIYQAQMEHWVFSRIPGLELFVLPYLVRFYFPFAVAFVTGIVIGGPFSDRTIQNALIVGTSRKNYYFSRLFVQLILTMVLFGAAVLAHTAYRLLRPMSVPGHGFPLFWVKFSVFMLISLLQLWALAAIFNAICYFVKKQLPAMGIALLIVYTEVLVENVMRAYHLSTATGILHCFPISALKYGWDYALNDQIFTFGFLKYGLSALVFILSGSAAGYLKFRTDSIV